MNQMCVIWNSFQIAHPASCRQLTPSELCTAARLDDAEGGRP